MTCDKFEHFVRAPPVTPMDHTMKRASPWVVARIRLPFHATTSRYGMLRDWRCGAVAVMPCGSASPATAAWPFTSSCHPTVVVPRRGASTTAAGDVVRTAPRSNNNDHVNAFATALEAAAPPPQNHPPPPVGPPSSISRSPAVGGLPQQLPGGGLVANNARRAVRDVMSAVTQRDCITAVSGLRSEPLSTKMGRRVFDSPAFYVAACAALTVADTLMVLEKMAALRTRHEGFQEAAVWRIFKAPLPSAAAAAAAAAAASSSLERAAYAVAVARTLRLAVECRILVHDPQFMAVALGRTVEMLPQLPSLSAVSNVLIALERWNRLYFTAREAVEHANAWGVARPLPSLLAAAAAPDGRGDRNAVAAGTFPASRAMRSDDPFVDLPINAAAAREADDGDPAAGSLLLQVPQSTSTAVILAPEGPSAIDSHFPNLIDVVADECEDRLLALTEQATASREELRHRRNDDQEEADDSRALVSTSSTVVSATDPVAASKGMGVFPPKSLLDVIRGLSFTGVRRVAVLHRLASAIDRLPFVTPDDLVAMLLASCRVPRRHVDPLLLDAAAGGDWEDDNPALPILGQERVEPLPFTSTVMEATRRLIPPLTEDQDDAVSSSIRPPPAVGELSSIATRRLATRGIVDVMVVHTSPTAAIVYAADVFPDLAPVVIGGGSVWDKTSGRGVGAVVNEGPAGLSQLGLGGLTEQRPVAFPLIEAVSRRFLRLPAAAIEKAIIPVRQAFEAHPGLANVVPQFWDLVRQVRVPKATGRSATSSFGSVGITATTREGEDSGNRLSNLPAVRIAPGSTPWTRPARYEIPLAFRKVESARDRRSASKYRRNPRVPPLLKVAPMRHRPDWAKRRKSNR